MKSHYITYTTLYFQDLHIIICCEMICMNVLWACGLFFGDIFSRPFYMCIWNQVYFIWTIWDYYFDFWFIWSTKDQEKKVIWIQIILVMPKHPQSYTKKLSYLQSKNYLTHNP